jgi:hypothetical protein
MTGRSSQPPGHALPPRQPSDEKQVGMKQPQEDDPSYSRGTRPPEYVIVTWISAELRDRLQRNNAALAQARQGRGTRAHGRKAEPEADREAEP